MYININNFLLFGKMEIKLQKLRSKRTAHGGTLFFFKYACSIFSGYCFTLICSFIHPGYSTVRHVFLISVMTCIMLRSLRDNGQYPLACWAFCTSLNSISTQRGNIKCVKLPGSLGYQGLTWYNNCWDKSSKSLVCRNIITLLKCMYVIRWHLNKTLLLTSIFAQMSIKLEHSQNSYVKCPVSNIF